MPDLDRLLDSALSTYSTPAADFEERLLHSIAKAAQPAPAPRRRWLPWAIALPAAACLLIALVVFLDARRPRTTSIQQAHNVPAAPVVATPEKSEPTQVAIRRPRTTHSVQRRALASTVAPPKQDVFPTPQPLTAEERVLVAAAATGDDAEHQKLLNASKPPPDAPLAIAGLSIPPLAPGDDGKK